jgi:hypothetical protein
VTELAFREGIMDQIRLREQRFDERAYLFVLASLEHCQARLTERRHITGPELAHSCRELALQRFGVMAGLVLDHWGLKGTGDIETRDKFKDFQLHIEWSAPNPPKGDSQGRGNSGVFLHGRYEVQVLDVFNNKTYADGQAGGLYGSWPPLVNAMKKPGEWNSYDIIFEGPRFDDAGNVTRKASVTVLHNGAVLHHRQEFIGPSGHQNVPKYVKYDGTGPIRLQDHGDPVRFRNIWIRDIGTYDRPEN